MLNAAYTGQQFHCTLQEKVNVLSQHILFRWICEGMYDKGYKRQIMLLFWLI